MPSDSSGTAPPGEQPDPPEAERFAEPQRLHPASVLLGIPFGQFLQAVIFPAFASLAAGGLFTLGLLAVLGLVGVPFRILDWRRRWFSFDGEVLRIDSGVLSRSHRTLDVARIQQVEIRRDPIQRLFGLAALRVETAGSASEPEVDLRVLRDEDAVALRAAVRVSKARQSGGAAAAQATTQADDDGAATEREVIQVPTRDVALASVTGARLLVLPAVIGGALQLIGQQIDAVIENAVDRFLADQAIPSWRELTTEPNWATVVVGALVVVALAAIAAVVVGVLRDGNFRGVLRDGDLQVQRGLLSTRESVVPLRRIQLVEVKRNWLRRMLHVCTVHIRSAGGSAGGEGHVTVPLLRDEQVDPLLALLLPGTPAVPPLRAHPRTAQRRAIFRWLRPALATIAAVWLASILVPAFDGMAIVERGRLAVLLLAPLAVVLAVVEYRNLGHALTERVVAARSGALSLTTTIAPVVKVQAVTSRRSLFQRRLGLTTMTAHVAGPGALLHVLDADVDDAAQLHARLTEHAAAPVPRPQPATS